MNPFRLCSILIIPLGLAACSTLNCPGAEPFPSTTYEVSEGLLVDLENAFDVDRSGLPCEAVCGFVYEDDGAGERLDTSACELSLEEPGANPEDIAGSVRCEGETFYGCE